MSNFAPMLRIFTIITILVCSSLSRMSAETPILGRSELSAERMYQFVKQRNKAFTLDIAETFIRVAERYGIRGDIALCQAILETGWFKFSDGTAVTPDQHNYCGLGVTQLGLKGHEFASVEEGVTAQIQHLYAYACIHTLPEGEKLIDPRFHRVKRGIAPSWERLNGKWAANDHYAKRILDIYRQMTEFVVTHEIGVEIPDDAETASAGNEGMMYDTSYYD